MNKDIVCQVPALVGPGKMPMQGSAGAWLPWALPAASAAVEPSRQLGAPPPGGGSWVSWGPQQQGLEAGAGPGQTCQGPCASGFPPHKPLPCAPSSHVQGSGKQSPSSVHGFTYSADLAEALRVCGRP